MNSKKICFIICANDDLYFGECIKYIQWLQVPEGMEIEVLEIRDAVSMTSGYNEGMHSSDAKYKVYLHSDVFIKNPHFIEDVLSIFEHDTQIGMIGMVGSRQLPANAVMWSGERVMYASECVPWEEYRYKFEDGYWDVACVDGLLMVTQYDVEWREDLFDGWDFYDISQSYEMRRQGWKVVVPAQRNAWFIHDDKVVLQLWNYDKYRKIFLEEYGEDIKRYENREPMLQFTEEFFEGEEREGFFVEEEMKRVWAAQMEVLVEIDKICRDNGIKYFAEFGTLLGAVRHKGFIPWDDDMDISMLREDYDRFCKIAPKVLQGTFLLENCYRDEKWTLSFMRVINADAVSIREERLKRFHGCPYVVGVDIFPLDYLPANKEEREVLRCLNNNLYVLREALDPKFQKEEQNVDELVEAVEEALKVKFDREKKLLPQVLQMIDKVSNLYKEEECEEIAVNCFLVTRDDKPRLKEWYRNTVMMPFENISIPVPEKYDEALKSMYGDYMTPVKNTAGHDYPYYKEQKEALQEMLRRNETIRAVSLTREG